jgi:hypothetical protein
MKTLLLSGAVIVLSFAFIGLAIAGVPKISAGSYHSVAKIQGFVYTVMNPNIKTTLQKTLTIDQWNSVETLVEVGGTGYFRRSFAIQ